MMMMNIACKASFAILAAALFNTCASATPVTVPPIKAAVTSDGGDSTQAYVGCLMRVVGRLDDYKSEPRTIATKMMSVCARELEQYVKVQSHGRNDVGRSLREASYGSVIQFVLQNRKASGYTGHILKVGRL
jgi:hypothetical protein